MVRTVEKRPLIRPPFSTRFHSSPDREGYLLLDKAFSLFFIHIFSYFNEVVSRVSEYSDPRQHDSRKSVENSPADRVCQQGYRTHHQRGIKPLPDKAAWGAIFNCENPGTSTKRSLLQQRRADPHLAQFLHHQTLHYRDTQPTSCRGQQSPCR